MPTLASSSYAYGDQPTGETNTLAIVSFVTGLLAFLGSGCCCVPVASLFAVGLVPLLALVSLITGFMGISAAKRTGTGKGMAIGGIGLGITGVIVAIGIYVMSVLGFVGLSILGQQ